MVRKCDNVLAKLEAAPQDHSAAQKLCSLLAREADGLRWLNDHAADLTAATA